MEFDFQKEKLETNKEEKLFEGDELREGMEQGFYDVFDQVKTIHKLDTRTGCMARIRFTVDDKKEKSVQSLRLSELMHEVNDVVSIASFSDSGTRLVKQKLVEVKLLLERDIETTRTKKNLNNVDDQNVHDVE
ncbi:hypothetical protein GBA52_010035 [Prunus armeniaca]|nr:hypothetical protein GBA52_010035 [Prunus armeniaca]